MLLHVRPCVIIVLLYCIEEHHYSNDDTGVSNRHSDDSNDDKCINAYGHDNSNAFCFTTTQLHGKSCCSETPCEHHIQHLYRMLPAGLGHQDHAAVSALGQSYMSS